MHDKITYKGDLAIDEINDVDQLRTLCKRINGLAQADTRAHADYVRKRKELDEALDLLLLNTTRPELNDIKQVLEFQDTFIADLTARIARQEVKITDLILRVHKLEIGIVTKGAK